MNKDSGFFTVNKLLRSMVFIFIDTFFSLYFFTLVNYRILPMAKYYLFTYLFLFIGFFLIRNFMKKEIKIGYYRISLGLLAIYLTLILLLKENISKYIVILGIIKGLAEGFYYYPTNIFDTEKITNENRKKYSGILNTVNTFISIILPIILGVFLDKYSYVKVGKVVMIFIIIMFLNSFLIKDAKYTKKNFDIKKFKKYIKTKEIFKSVAIIRILEGLTYSSSALNVVMTLYSIIFLKNNTHYGAFNSVLAIISLITTTIYAYSAGKKDKKIIIFTNVITSLSLGYLFFKASIYSLSLFLIIYNSFITYVILLSKNKVANITNEYKEVQNKYKAEYHLYIEFYLALGRLIGYLLLVFISIFDNIFYFKILILIGIVSYITLLCFLKRINE